MRDHFKCNRCQKIRKTREEIKETSDGIEKWYKCDTCGTVIMTIRDKKSFINVRNDRHVGAR